MRLQALPAPASAGGGALARGSWHELTCERWRRPPCRPPRAGTAPQSSVAGARASRQPAAPASGAAPGPCAHYPAHRPPALAPAPCRSWRRRGSRPSCSTTACAGSRCVASPASACSPAPRRGTSASCWRCATCTTRGAARCAPRAAATRTPTWCAACLLFGPQAEAPAVLLGCRAALPPSAQLWAWPACPPPKRWRSAAPRMHACMRSLQAGGRP